jgi:hypothetical protein
MAVRQERASPWCWRSKTGSSKQLARVSTKALIADDIRYRRDTPDNAGAPADHAQTCGARYLGIFAANSWGSTSTRTAFYRPNTKHLISLDGITIGIDAAGPAS